MSRIRASLTRGHRGRGQCQQMSDAAGPGELRASLERFQQMSQELRADRWRETMAPMTREGGR